MNPVSISYTCRECERELDLKVWPLIRGNTFGPPESCYPDEGGEFEPEECPHCGQKIDQTLVNEIARESFDSPDEI